MIWYQRIEQEKRMFARVHLPVHESVLFYLFVEKYPVKCLIKCLSCVAVFATN